MAVPSTNVGLSDIQTEFGGSNPISMSEYYSGGANVPAGVVAPNGPIPSSGQISVGQFRGAFVPTPYSVDYLVIGGGGGGGGASPNSADGGGAGAGGYRNSYASETSGGGAASQSSRTFNPQTVYTITIGQGGAGRTGQPAGRCTGGGKGNTSSLAGSDITNVSSSGGGIGSDITLPSASDDGSSGGGGSNFGPSGGTGTANEGFNGGSNLGGGPTGQTGGGGSAKELGNTPGQGHGGNGLASSITGAPVLRGGGGGGGGSPSRGNAGEPGGTGGGGDGGSSGPGQAGTANTGGGGGGGGGPGIGNGGNGGSGVVILRMPTLNYTGTTTGSPTVQTDGSDTILTFTGSGTYTG